MSWQLQHEGYQVQMTKRAADGLAQVVSESRSGSAGHYDAGYGRLEACQRIREVSDVPIIFTTALALREMWCAD